MLVFNQKMVKEINTKASKGEPVVIKLKTEPSNKKAEAKKNKRKTVDSVTSGSFETKMHFAKAQVITQHATLKKDR